MKTSSQNCPICNCEIQNSTIEFCPTCGWEHMTITENASQGLKAYYSNKLELNKKIFYETQQLKKDIDTLKRQREEREKRITELEEKNNSYACEKENQKLLFEKIKQIEQEKIENDKAIKDLKEKLRKEKAAHEATKTKSGFTKFNTK